METTNVLYLNEFITAFINKSDINRITLRSVLNHLQEQFPSQDIPQDYVLKFVSEYTEERKKSLKEMENGSCPIVSFFQFSFSF